MACCSRKALSTPSSNRRRTGARRASMACRFTPGFVQELTGSGLSLLSVRLQTDRRARLAARQPACNYGECNVIEITGTNIEQLALVDRLGLLRADLSG